MSESERLRKEAESLMMSENYPQARKLLVHARFSAADAAEKQSLMELQIECEKRLTGWLDAKIAGAANSVRAGEVEAAIKLYEEAFTVADALGTPAACQQRTEIADNLANLYLGLRRLDRAQQYADISGKPIKTLAGLPAKSALQTLKQNGLLKELSDEILDEILDDFDRTIDDIDTMSILTAFYEFGLNERAMKDGFLAHDCRFGQETSDVVAEFSALIGGEPLLKLIEFRNSEDTIHVRRRSGEEISSPFYCSLDEVVAVFNLELERVGDRRRFVSLQTDGDFFSYYLLDSNTYQKLCRTGQPAVPAASVPGVNDPEWDVVLAR